MPEIQRTRSFQPTPAASAPLPSTPAARTTALRSAGAPVAPAAPVSVPTSALPRSSVTEATRNSGLRNPAVSAVLFGVQGIGALAGIVGTASTAHAADLPAATPQDVATRLADLESRRATMTPSELASARRELFRTFVSATQQATTFPFETEWSNAAAGSIDRAKVADALKQMGAEGTETKLLAVHAQFADKLAPDAKADLEVAIAGRMLDGASKDGALDTADVTSVETKLQAKLGGEEAGTRALLRAFPTHLDTLDDGAIAHLLSRATAVETHAKRLVSIVDEMLDGKNVVVDVNGDGKIDTGDVVLTETKDGKHLVERVSKNLADETRVSKAMVDASEKMHGAGVSFAITTKHFANSDFWTVGSGGTLELKPGVKPSDAVRDIVEHGNKYGFECATGLVAVYYQAMLDLIGPADFDRVAADIRLGPWQMDNDLSGLITNVYPHADQGVETELGDVKLVPGHYYYFRNWDVTDEARARGWQGENVIYLGEGKFYGHGIGLGQGSEFVAKLSGEMKPGGKTPSLLNLTAFLHTDVLKLDLDPAK